MSIPILPRNLPRPDSFGNYWLAPFGTGQRDVSGPAVLHSSRIRGFWIASRGTALGGVLWDGVAIKLFSSPQEAFVELKKALGQRC